MSRRSLPAALIALVGLLGLSPGAGAAVDAWSTGVQPGGHVATAADRGHRLRLVLTLRNAPGRAVVRGALSAVVR
jgi:hypothetical protein